MTQRTKLDALDRRDFIAGASAVAIATVVFGKAGLAHAQDKPQTFDDIYGKIVGEAKPEDGKVTIDMPEIAENGNTVPYTVSVDSPMTDGDYVKTVHVLSSGNPSPNIATYHFSPLSGAAKVSSRMRLAKTQDIVAVAELSSGKKLIGKRTVKVTIGGCGG
ncbi:MAG: thiosulfate oxidation carrier protein SoxY [Hyphomicrobiaceae bacterium]|nr:thiosulfate oxidation carrier protein SoxY [Hyphomicrobiaceae bacterium]